VQVNTAFLGQTAKINVKHKPSENILEDKFGTPNYVIDPKLKTDIESLKETFKAFEPKVVYFHNTVNKYDFVSRFTSKEAQKTFNLLSPIAPVRRISSIPESIKEGNEAKAIGLLALAVVNFPEDKRDIASSLKQIFKGEMPKYDFKHYQHPFSFIRGTILEKPVNKLGKLGVKLHKMDKTLLETNFGKLIREKVLKVDIIDQVATGRKVDRLFIDKSGKVVKKKCP